MKENREENLSPQIESPIGCITLPLRMFKIHGRTALLSWGSKKIETTTSSSSFRPYSPLSRSCSRERRWPRVYVEVFQVPEVVTSPSWFILRFFHQSLFPPTSYLLPPSSGIRMLVRCTSLEYFYSFYPFSLPLPLPHPLAHILI